ncbi:MAG: VanW family protein [Anaerolineales bacterium]|nr:VanW family protein [Chloroflexota bacterium]MBK6645844.1 VanW family protein [Anaerolineales bacterium]MCC6985728.1 VanW family protein [Anaerolineales bacterium]
MTSRRDLPKQILAALIGGLALFAGIVLMWTIIYQLSFAGRIFPGVSVAGVDLSGLSRGEAALKLSQTLSYASTGKILFRDGEKVWVASPVELGMVFDPTASADAAYAHGREGGVFGALSSQIRARGLGADVPPVILFDQRVAYAYLQNIAVQVNQPVAEAVLRVDGTNVISEPGRMGRALNLDATLIYLGAQLQSFRDGEVPLVIAETAPLMLDVSAQAEQARVMLSQSFTMTLPNTAGGGPGPWTFEVPVLANMLTITFAADANGAPQAQVGLDEKELRKSLGDLKVIVDRQPSDARFVFNDSNGQIEAISSSAVGRAMDVEASIDAVNAALQRGEHSVNLVVAEQQPAVSDQAFGADLGIVELVATQTTYFYGSSEARIQNIVTASAQYHGLLIAPGETFSMGSVLGDVSLENGYAEALIIYGGRTIKGVGGGVCQVSTTLFRTVFFAGFPIVERYSHAYRVPYYEMDASGHVDGQFAGMDATVYFPLVDFKFQNDTPHWMLMETYVDVGARTLTWKIYSTSDGRSVTWETTGPQNVVAPPETVFEENPELDANEIKQVDYAAEGADVTVTRTVWRGGLVYFTDQIQTHYEPWAAVCQFGPGSDSPKKLARKSEICNVSS